MPRRDAAHGYHASFCYIRRRRAACLQNTPMMSRFDTLSDAAFFEDDFAGMTFSLTNTAAA